MRRFSGPILLVLGALLTQACTRTKAEVKAQRAPAAIEVKTAPVEFRRVDRAISVTGSLVADESVSLSSEVAGRVRTLYFDFGQSVKKGQVVAQLDTTEYRFQLDRSRAALAQARAQLGLDPGSEASPADTPGMKQARAQMEDAKFKYESAAKLVKTGDISAERFTELEKAWHAREAAFEATQNEMRTVWANIAGLKADVEIAQKRIDDCSVRAPFDGAVAEKLVSPGQYTKENTALVTLVKTTPLRLRAELPEAASDRVKPGSSLIFTTDAAPGLTFKATVRQLNPTLDAKSRMLMVEARMEGSDARLRPGMFVQVKLVTEPGAQVTVVPEQAVYSLAGLTKIFVVRDGKAHEIRLGAPTRTDGFVEVPGGGLKPGDKVAITNLPMLIDGAAVGARG